ncbi:MAG: FAD-dependent oxidoreductase [Bacteroidota bacterium]
MISFWERESFINYDFIIIGAGIVGLSTALALRDKDHKASIAVLEKGILPTGASTKNAGFACFGSLTELLADIRTFGEENTLALVQTRVTGLQKLRKRIGDNKLDYQQNGGYELIKEKELNQVDELDRINNLLQPLFQDQVFHLKPELIPKFGFKTVETVVFNPYEGQLDTGRMMQCLLKIAAENNIKIYTGAEVLRIEEGSPVKVKIVSDHISLSMHGGRVIVCTNAFTKRLLPAEDLTPGRGLVLVTNPISNLRFKGTFHIDQGYYYFRDFENRVIFGGGRNEFIDEENTTTFEVNQRILEILKSKLNEIILPDSKYSIDMIWTGIMAFGATKKPILRRHSENILVGARLGGMGVAIGSELGYKLAAMALSDQV